MDRDALTIALSDAFDADDEDLRVVTRQARDLADAGTYAADLDHELTPEVIVEHLSDAPEGYSLAEAWNWWLGSLELSHGGYTRFEVRTTGA